MANITSSQCRAARAMLKWTTKDLSEAANVGINTVTRFESDKPTHGTTGRHLQKAFEDQGITFSADGCVCPPKDM